MCGVPSAHVLPSARRARPPAHTVLSSDDIRVTCPGTVGAVEQQLRRPVGRAHPLGGDVVQPLDPLLGEHLGGLPVGVDSSVAQQHQPVAVAGGEVQVVEHDDRRDAFLAHDPQRPVLGAEVEVVRRLVQEQHPRLLGEHAREEHPLPLPAGEPPELHPRERQRVDPRESRDGELAVP